MCYFWIEAKGAVSQGDFITVEFTSLKDVETYVSIKSQIDDYDGQVLCNVRSGDTIVLRYPEKMFLSFKGLSPSGKYFISAWYS